MLNKLRRCPYVIRLMIVSFFLTTSPLIAMHTDCIGEIDPSSSSTIRFACKYNCPQQDEWGTWRSNLSYVAIGIAIPYVVEGLNFLRKKVIDWYHGRAALRYPTGSTGESETTPITAGGASSDE